MMVTLILNDLKSACIKFHALDNMRKTGIVMSRHDYSGERNLLYFIRITGDYNNVDGVNGRVRQFGCIVCHMYSRKLKNIQLMNNHCNSHLCNMNQGRTVFESIT